MSIEFEGNDSLVIAFFGDDNCSGSCNSYKVGLLKTDLNGNVSFSKTYDLTAYPRELIRSMNVTEDAYVIFGEADYTSAGSRLFVLKTDKNGNLLTSKLISKTGSALLSNPGYFNTGGSSEYINSVHTFSGSIDYGVPTDRDMVLLQMDENLQSTNDCFVFGPVTVVTEVITPYTNNLQIIDKPNVVTMTNVLTQQVYALEGCGQDDVVFDETAYGCDSVVVTISSLSGTNYQLTWSNGTTGNTETFYTSDTVLVEFYDPLNCCNFTDTVEISLANEFPLLNLPADTTLCIPSDETYEIVPVITGCGTCIFEWNDTSTDPTLIVDNTGWYSLTVTNSCGFQDQDSMYVEINFLADLAAINDTLICGSALPLTISALSTNADSLVWSNGTVGSSAVFTTTGAAYVQAYAPCGMLQENFTIDTIAPVSIQPITSIDTCLYVGQQLTIPISAVNYTSLTANDVVLTSPTVIAVDDTVFNIVATNSCGADSIQFTVAIGPYPVYTNPGGIDTCLADGTPLEIEVDVTDALITWWNGSNDEQQTITSEGTYFFTITNSCATIPDSIVVSYSTQPSVSFLGTLDTCLLPGDSLLVSYTGSGLTVFWSANGNDTLVVTQSGTYYAEVGTPCGVMYVSLQITIHPVQQLPQLDTLHFCGAALRAADLGISSEYPVVFTSSAGDSLGHFIFESGDYVVHQYTPCGELQENFRVIFDSEVFFYAPNSFTPGDDELNGIYAFKGENYTIQEVLIFDRWGQVVYKQQGAFDGWDGNNHGHICPTGTYVVKVTYTACDDIPETLFLHVNLLR